MQIDMNLPNDFVAFQSVADIENDMRLSYSLWLFKNSRVRKEKAAELAGLDIYDFMVACKRNEVAVIDISNVQVEPGGYAVSWNPITSTSANTSYGVMARWFKLLRFRIAISLFAYGPTQRFAD